MAGLITDEKVAIVKADGFGLHFESFSSMHNLAKQAIRSSIAHETNDDLVFIILDEFEKFVCELRFERQKEIEQEKQYNLLTAQGLSHAEAAEEVYGPAVELAEDEGTIVIPGKDFP